MRKRACHGRHRKKLNNLAAEQDRPLFAVESSVVNISGVNIPVKFMRFLQRGVSLSSTPLIVLCNSNVSEISGGQRCFPK